MSDLELMSKAIDFVEANLKQAISVADMADAVSYSLYHFCRTFNQVTQHTPYDYLMRRRLSEAAQALLETDQKIIDIGLDYQFNSPETFSRAFKRMFDVQPSQWRKHGCIKRWQLMPRLTLAHLQHVGRGAYLKPILEEKGAFDVAGFMTLVRDDPAVVQELWDILGQELQRHGYSLRPGDCYGITWYPPDWGRAGFLYMAGVSIQGPNTPSPALVVKTVPAAQYARFIHKGPTRQLALTLDYVYHTWLPRSGQRLASPLVLEHYSQDLKSAECEESEREVYFPIQL